MAKNVYQVFRNVSTGINSVKLQYKCNSDNQNMSSIPFILIRFISSTLYFRQKIRSML